MIRPLTTPPASSSSERRTAPAPTVEKYTYDGFGRLISAKKGTSGNDDAVNQSIFAYDSLSRVDSESQAIAEGTAKVVNYDCDKGGNRTEIIFHDTATTATFGYDTRDRCTARPGPQRRDGVRVRPAATVCP